MSKEKAKEYFVKGCNEYLRLFCEKHDFDYEDAKDSWVGGSVGEITEWVTTMYQCKLSLPTLKWMLPKRSS